MKKILIIFGALFIFSACSSNGNFVYQELLSKEEGKYSVYMVGNEEVVQEAHDILLNSGYNRINALDASYREDLSNLRYPGLEIEELPAFFLIDTQNIVYKSYDLNEFITYIDEYLASNY